jgi:hypothetical protein
MQSITQTKRRPPLLRQDQGIHCHLLQTQARRLRAIHQGCEPSGLRSANPSSGPSQQRLGTQHRATVQPSIVPTNSPFSRPTASPRHAPSYVPSVERSSFPSIAPSIVPTSTPSSAPTNGPSSQPASAHRATVQPSIVPTNSPFSRPTASPSHAPSYVPSVERSSFPSNDNLPLGESLRESLSMMELFSGWW